MNAFNTIMSVQEKIRLKRAQIKYIRRYNIRQKALKVILCVLLIAFAIDMITAVLNSKRVISISANPAMARSTSEDAVAEASTLSGDTAHEASEPMAQSPDDIEKLIAETFPDAPQVALAIAKCESGLVPTRIGDTHMDKHSYGLFQINQTWHPYSEETLLNPQENIRIAKEIYDSFEEITGDGFNAWSCYKQKLYLKSI